MAARSLEQIFSELGSIYDPQANLIRQQQSAIPGQIAEEEKGLGAKQEAAFGEILGGARRRGLGFSGIPLSEQAKYTSTEFLPALARLRQSGREQATSLEQAILGIQERRGSQAQAIRQSEEQQDLAERQFAESIRQFNEQLRAQAEERARSAAAARSAAYSPTFGGGGGGGATPPNPVKVKAQQAVSQLLGTKDNRLINETYNAIKKSAGYGNTYDQMKLQLIEALYPQIRKPAPRAPVPNSFRTADPLGILRR